MAIGGLFGLMYATKETWIVAAAAMALAAFGRWKQTPPRHLAIAAAAFVAIAALFLSSFLTIRAGSSIPFWPTEPTSHVASA